MAEVAPSAPATGDKLEEQKNDMCLATPSSSSSVIWLSPGVWWKASCRVVPYAVNPATLGILIFTCCYSYQTLIEGKENWFVGLSPSRTVAIINTLSQIMVWSLTYVVHKSYMAIWHPQHRKQPFYKSYVAQLLEKERSDGSCHFVISTKTLHLVHRWFQIVTITLMTIVSLALLWSTNVVDIYTPILDSAIHVFSGLAPTNFDILMLVPLPTLCTLFLAFMYEVNYDRTFLTISPEPVKCVSNKCTSLYLPGSLQQTRQADTSVNGTLFQITDYPDAPLFIIPNSRGYQLDFSSPIPRSLDFTFDKKSCEFYGRDTGQGFYICLEQLGMDLMAGWSFCPSIQFNKKQCFDDLAWADVITTNTTLSVYRRTSTVTYSRQDATIIDLGLLSTPTQVLYPADKLSKLFGRVLVPPSTTVSNGSADFEATSMTVATQYAFGWALRLFADQYKRYAVSPLLMLHGWLVIPIQSSTMLWATLDFETLPPELLTTAYIGRDTPYNKASFVSWQLFVASAVTLYVLSQLCFLLAWLVKRGTFGQVHAHDRDIDGSLQRSDAPEEAC